MRLYCNIIDRVWYIIVRRNFYLIRSTQIFKLHVHDIIDNLANYKQVQNRWTYVVGHDASLSVGSRLVSLWVSCLWTLLHVYTHPYYTICTQPPRFVAWCAAGSETVYLLAGKIPSAYRGLYSLYWYTISHCFTSITRLQFFPHFFLNSNKQ